MKPAPLETNVLPPPNDLDVLVGALARTYPEVFETYLQPALGTDDPDPKLISFLRDLATELVGFSRLKMLVIELMGDVEGGDCPACHAAMGPPPATRREQEHAEGCCWLLIVAELADDIDANGGGTPEALVTP